MGIGSALALGVERLIAPVEGIHTVVVRRWMRRLGPLGRRVGPAYEAAAGLVYGSIRIGTAAVGAGLDRVVSVQPSTMEAIRSWTNGFFGDGLGRHERRLGTSMALRVDPTADATDRLVVLVHGLGRTERCWEGSPSAMGLAQAVADHPGLTPLPLRYNTGLSVADNGKLLSDLMEDVTADWPVMVDSVALVGHSMGGLVIAEAFAAGRRGGRSWVDRVTDIVTIGTPHRGAPLEKLVAGTARGLAAFSTTQPLAGFLDGRSAGIKDLGSTAHVDENPLREVRRHLIAGVATSDPDHPLGRLVGDFMVRTPSSTRPHGAEVTNALVVGGVTHFDLLDHPAVIDQVMAWLDRRG
jgi:pimeloyl-ACP methyl ester carboxylesterase